MLDGKKVDKTKKDKKVFIECPPGVRCACEDFKLKDYQTQTKYCHIGGRTFGGNEIVDAKKVKAESLLEYEDLLSSQLKCIRKKECTFETKRALSLAGHEGADPNILV